MWPLGLPLAMHVHLSTSPTGDVFSSKWHAGYRKNQDADLPSFVWQNITLGDWNEKRVADFEVKLPEVRFYLAFFELLLLGRRSDASRGCGCG